VKSSFALRRALALGMAMLALGGCTTLGPDGRAGTPDWYCTLQERAAGRSWLIDDDIIPLWGHWTYFGEERVHVMGFVSGDDPREIALFRDGGYLAPGVETTVYVSPMRPIPSEGAWLTLRGNGAEIAPVFYGETKHGSSAVRLTGAQLAPLLAGDQDVTLIVQDKAGAVLHEVTLPRAALAETAAHLSEVFAKVEEMQRDKPARCFDHRDDIILAG
jgi:hypothetical protein